MKKIACMVMVVFVAMGTMAFESYNEAMKAGMEAKKKKDYSTAAVAFKEAYAKADTQARKIRSKQEEARALFDSKKRKKAVAAQKELIDLPDLKIEQKANIIYMYGWYLKQNQQSLEAEKILAATIKLKGISNGMLFELYSIYIGALVDQKKKDEAMKALEKMGKLGVQPKRYKAISARIKKALGK